MRPSEAAWISLGVGVVAYEAFCGDGELMSEQVDRWIDEHPIATRVAIGTVALHLANLLPNQIDPIHNLSKVKHFIRRNDGA